jgi:hypothetical protein
VAAFYERLPQAVLARRHVREACRVASAQNGGDAVDDNRL